MDTGGMMLLERCSRHWAIKDAFFTGAGKYLQRIDSDLAEGPC